MSVSRDNILTIIRQSDGANVDGLAKEMELAPATVRRHLDILERDGLVDHVEVRKPTGRPQYSFHLTEKGHDSVPKDYSRLLNELVMDFKNATADSINGKSGDEVIRAALTRIGIERAVEYGKGRRPVEAVEAAFDAGGYDPIITADGDGLTIRVTNCPYRRASVNDDIICTVDRSMIRHLLGDGVEHTVEMSAVANECVYSLGYDQLIQIDSAALGE